MGIQFVSANAAVGSSVSYPSGILAGDYIFLGAFRDGSTTTPGIATGFLNLGSGGASSCSGRIMFRIADGTESGSVTSTNATEMAIAVYRGPNGTTGTGASAQSTGASNLISYAANTLQVTDGTSWVVCFGGHRTATDVNQAPTGTTLRASATGVAVSDTNGGVSSWSSQSITVNASSGWRSFVLELKVPPPIQVGTGALTLTGFAPTFRSAVLAKPETGALSLTGLAPTVLTPRVVRPDVGALTIIGFEPTVLNSLVVRPDVGALAVTGFTPTILTPRVVRPGVGALTVTGFASTVLTPRVVRPGAGSLSLTGFTPTALTPRVVVTGSGVLVVAGFAPTVLAPRVTRPDVGAIVVTGLAPTILTPRVAKPDAGDLAVTGFAPAIMTPVMVIPGVGLLQVSGFAPTVEEEQTVLVALRGIIASGATYRSKVASGPSLRAVVASGPSFRARNQ